jgi:hypothetical protein
MGKVGLGCGKLAERFSADVQDVPGVETVGHGTVEGAFADEIQRTALQRINLIVNENVARTCQREQNLKMVVKVQSAHAPGLVLIQLEIEFDICHRMTSVVLVKKTNDTGRRWENCAKRCKKQENGRIYS